MENSISKKNVLSPIAKGVLVSVCVSVVGVLLLALLFNFFGLSDGTIKIVNQFIKVLSIFCGTLLALKNNLAKGYLKGMCVGALYTVLCYTVFCVLSSTFSFGAGFVFDLIFGAIMGAICGILCSNLRK